MWETAEKAGVRTANLMWYVMLDATLRFRFGLTWGQARTAKDHKRCFFDVLRTLEGVCYSSYSMFLSHLGYAAQDHVPLKEKLDQILSWIDMPIETRPQFIMGSSGVILAYCCRALILTISSI